MTGSAGWLARALERAHADSPTYPELSATRDPELPAGYAHLCRRARVGGGEGAFAEAARAVTGWRMHRGVGARVYPLGIAPDAGTTVLVLLGIGMLRITAPCRVIWSVDEPTRFGFGYGTLPGHPECGEESFVVSRDEAGDVWFEVRAFSRPASWYARLGGPLTRWFQYRAAGAYLRAVTRDVRRAEGGRRSSG